MKMKELERRTGVSREAIRFYIREGLVPEPERPKKNVARYQDTHVDAIKLIKHLQDDQQLPLDVIKPMVRAQSHLSKVDAKAIPAIDALLAQGLGAAPQTDLVTLTQASAQTDLPVETIMAMDDIGMISTEMDEEGARSLSGQDFAIVRQWAALQELSFADGAGFSLQTAKLYVQLIHWLADQELSIFLSQVAGRMGAAKAADAAAQAIGPVNEMLGLMRSRALERKLRELRPPDPKKSGKKKT